MAKPGRYTRTITLSWQEVHRDARILAGRLARMGPWRGIVCVTRGGLVPAAILARELDIRLVDTVCIASYDGREQRKVEVLKTIEQDGEGWLLVDDLADTGDTAGTVRTILPRAYFVTLYAKPDGRPMVDACITEVSQDTWIEFPWDSPPPPAD